MKKIFAAIFVASLVGNVFGDAGVIIREKARSMANQNNAPQGRPPQAPTASQPAKPAKPAAPTAPSLTVEQQALANDLAVVKSDDVTRFKTHLTAMTHGTNQPSSAVIQKLANDLAKAVAGKTLSTAQRVRIAQDISTILNGNPNISAARMEAYIVDVPTILKMAGVTSDLTAAIGDDLRAARKESSGLTPVSH